MGSVLSLFWSEEKPAQDDKYKQGVGNTPQQNKPKPKAATVGASADRNKKKKPKGKINKNMIGQPANFQVLPCLEYIKVGVLIVIYSIQPILVQRK